MPGKIRLKTRFLFYVCVTLAFNIVAYAFLVRSTNLSSTLMVVFIIWQFGSQAIFLLYKLIPWNYLYPASKESVSFSMTPLNQEITTWSYVDVANILFNITLMHHYISF